ncbi:hypothetical protein GCM10022221_45570 [Actinocorallia aurea]
MSVDSTGSVDFTGSMGTADGEAVAEVLGAWLGLDLKVRVRLHGWEVHHDADRIEVYAYEALGSSTPLTLFSGAAALSFAEAHPLFASLHAHCVSRGLSHEVEYEAEDGDAQDPDRIRILRHP